MNQYEVLLQMVNERIDRSRVEISRAKRRIPEEYHDFIVGLDQSVRLMYWDTSTLGELPFDLQRKGAYINRSNNFVYVNVQVPYCKVEGKIAMARDEHKKAGKQLIFHRPQITYIDGFTKPLMEVVVESELYGSSIGLIEVNINGKGADTSNPISSAQTSAIGRALHNLGYGLIGNGNVSTEEEMRNILKEEGYTLLSDDEEFKKLYLPTTQRVLLLSKPEPISANDNKDLRYAADVMLESKDVVKLVFADSQEHSEFASGLEQDDVIKIRGYLSPTELRAERKNLPIFDKKATDAKKQATNKPTNQKQNKPTPAKANSVKKTNPPKPIEDISEELVELTDDFELTDDTVVL